MQVFFFVLIITNKFETILYKYEKLNFILLTDELLFLKITILIISFL